MELFSITCTTCRARLKVRDAAAIGQILGCPKCGSMVQVAAPAGWQPPAVTDEPSSSGALSGSSASNVSSSGRWREEVAPGDRQRAAASTPAASRSGSAWRDPVPAGGASAATAAGSIWSRWTWTHWVLWAGLPTVALAAAVSLWVWSSKRPPLQAAPVAALEPLDPANAPESEPASAPEAAAPALAALDRRWVPTATQGLLSLPLHQWNEQPTAQAVFYHLGAVWNRAVEPLFTQFDLTPEQIRRLTWMTTDVARRQGDDWLASGVTIIELAPESGQNRPALDEGGRLEWTLGGAPVHPSSSPDWPHPFALVDEFTIVTGPEERLKELADRSAPGLASAELGRLLDLLDLEQGAAAAVDLAAVRTAGVMPEWLPLVDVWHVSRDDWRVVREMPRALSVEFALTDSLNVRLRLACETETAAEQSREALDRLLGAMEQTAAGEVDGLTQKLLAGEITAAGAGRFKRLLSAGGEALKARESGVDGAVAWTRTPWKGDLPALAVAALASIPELETSRLAAARLIDEQNHEQLLQGLEGYEKAEGALPFGAAGASLLPPETRLSWIATLLPYYDRLDWHGELNFARSWNDAANSRVTRRPLESVINPALGPGTTSAGFPVTHYVGLAGVGADAGLLEPSDPRAGAFGYRRQLGLAEITDGASNTIALMGVSGQLGAWASGGEATVRPLAKQPYINGPDGFGSGQPNGMLAGMADGSVRFLSKDIDPSVLEALATINGGEKLPPTLDRAGKLGKSTPENAEEMADEPDGEAAPATVRARPRVLPGADADAAARLKAPLPAVEFDRTPLADAVQLLSQLSGVPITLDLEALAEVGVAPTEKISLQMTDTTIGDALSAALKELGLAYVIVDGQALVTNPERREQNLKEFAYDVSDLATGDSGGDLAALVERFVEPTSWQAAGGSGELAFAKQRLVLQQTAPVAQQVSLFLDKLRLARGKPVKGDEETRLRSLATRSALAKELLDAPVTANFQKPATLAEIVDHLRSATGSQILFDGLALAGVGASEQSEARLAVAERPLAEALKTLLEPLGLSYRIAGEKTLVITAVETVRGRFEVEFYQAKELVNDDRPGQALVERIKSELAPRSWDDAGGPGMIEFDAASSCLIVLQTQVRQIELEQMLAGWKEKATK